jgi:hypothetical protein
MKIIAIIILVIIFGGVIFGIIWTYKNYEKPLQEQNQTFVDVNILAYNGENLVKTGYNLYTNNSLYSTGNTSDRAATIIEVPENNSVKVENFNIENQTFYKTNLELQTFTGLPKRVVLSLDNPGLLNITHKGKFGENLYLYLIIKSQGYFKNLTVCLDWSSHILTAELINMQRNYNLSDKCYDAKTLEKNETYYIDMGYVYFGNIDKNDYINLSFYDFDDNYSKRQFYEIR